MRNQYARKAGACPFSGARLPENTNPSAIGAAVSATPVARRTVLGGFLALAAAQTFSTLHRPLVAVAAARRAAKGAHGGLQRGLDVAVKAGRNTEARFGLMFKNLPAFNPSDSLLKQLARSMNDQKAPLSDVKDSDVEYDNPGMPAGYIYLGQFIDHDMTRDTTPLSEQKQDVKGMVNYDSPRFDLGSVYGGGPAANPELYDPSRPGYLRVNEHDDIVDLPRDEVGAAYLGDPRNDENLIVAQLHTVFLRLHNKFRDQGMSFEQARQRCRFLYQWLIVHDFLPRLVGRPLVNSLLSVTGSGVKFKGKFYKPRQPTRPYMPIEYAGAAYRFGHSMIRAEYEVHDQNTVPIFAPDGYPDLRGNRPHPANLWVDWNYFFDIPGVGTPDDRNMARLIDSQISLPLSTLPSTVVAPTADAITALSERNLLRGKRLGLPAGQDVAIAMGIKPLTNPTLGLGPEWKGKAPLWFYILKEAEILRGGRSLGPVGAQIVAEVILGILAADKTSYFTRQPSFNPGSGFAMGDLILMADALDPRALEQEQEVPEGAEEEPGGVEEPHAEEPEPLDPDEQIDPEATSPLPGQV